MKSSQQMSVPKEFRRWAWWFLNKRYGKRAAPQMKGCVDLNEKGDGKCQGRWGKGRGKHGHGGHGGHHEGKSGHGKLHHLAVSPP